MTRKDKRRREIKRLTPTQLARRKTQRTVQKTLDSIGVRIGPAAGIPAGMLIANAHGKAGWAVDQTCNLIDIAKRVWSAGQNIEIAMLWRDEFMAAAFYIDSMAVKAIREQAQRHD